MAIDRIDVVAIGGTVGLVAAATALEVVFLAAMAGGLFLSVAVWRVAAARVWEALGWLAWVGAAALLALDPTSAAVLATFIGFGLVGTALLLGGRFGLLLDVWAAD